MIVVVFLIWCSSLNTAIAQDLSKEQERLIQIYSQRYLGKSKQWVVIMKSIRMTECNQFRCYKSSKKGDNSFGGWQIQPATARDVMGYLEMKEILNDEQLINRLIYDDKFSTKIAVRYFAWLFKETNDLDLAIISYNSGIGDVINKLKGGKPLPQEYLRKVRKLLNKNL